MSDFLRSGRRVLEIDIASGDFQKMPTFTEVQTSIMPLVHRRGGEMRALGTCFCISNQGLCLTARHVVDEAFPNIESTVLDVKDGELFALYVGAPHGPEPDAPLNGGLLPVNKMYFSPDLDVAALSLTMMSDVKTGELIPMPAFALGVTPPHVGTSCLAVGYHKMSWTADEALVSVDQGFAATRGVVEELHIPRRDRFQLHFPCFRTSAHYPGGMSGAPVFTEDGFVRGVVCSEIEMGGDGDAHISYASLVGPSLLLTLEGNDGPGQPSGQRFLADFALGGAVRADLTGVELRRGERDCSVRIGNTTISNQFPPVT